MTSWEGYCSAEPPVNRLTIIIGLFFHEIRANSAMNESRIFDRCHKVDTATYPERQIVAEPQFWRLLADACALLPSAEFTPKGKLWLWIYGLAIGR